MPTEETVLRNIRLPEGVDEKLVAAAERANKSVTALIREILERVAVDLAAQPAAGTEPAAEARK
jgi:hypothetical protein